MDVFEELRELSNPEKAEQMAAYMKNQFPFLGIQTPERRKFSNKYFKAIKKDKINWDFIFDCWNQEEREYQYLGLDYLRSFEKILVSDDLINIRELIINKSWWDTVDGLVKPLGKLALRFPEINEVLVQWSLDENIWLRRSAIIHQLQRKEKTNEELLEEILVNNLNQGEFFINKAIGWALRDYSKTSPHWVRDFIKRHERGLAPLSIREASKYI